MGQIRVRLGSCSRRRQTTGSALHWIWKIELVKCKTLTLSRYLGPIVRHWNTLQETLNEIDMTLIYSYTFRLVSEMMKFHENLQWWHSIFEFESVFGKSRSWRVRTGVIFFLIALNCYENFSTPILFPIYPKSFNSKLSDIKFSESACFFNQMHASNTQILKNKT